MAHKCSVCGADLGWDRPSGVCSEACLRIGQGFPAPVLFCDLPDQQRLGYRDAITAAGGEVAAYVGECVQVAIPRPSGPFYAAMQAAGLECVPGSLHYFPLGSDKPADVLRHDGRYHGSRGFWLYGNFRPRV